MTGNPPPSTKPEYLKRVRTRNFPTREVHLPGSMEAVEYKRWLTDNLKRCRSLGQYRNKFVMEHQDIILDSQLTPFEKSRRIWTAIYGSVGLTLPELFNKQLEETQMKRSLEEKQGDVSTALHNWILDKCKGQYEEDKRLLDQYTTSVERLEHLINRNLVSCVRHDSQGKFVFLRQIVLNLEHYGIKHLDLQGLADAIPGTEYGKNYHGRYAVKCDKSTLTNFLDD